MTQTTDIQPVENASNSALAIAETIKPGEAVRFSYAQIRKELRAIDPELKGDKLTEAVESRMKGYKAAFAAVQSEADTKGFTTEQSIRRLKDGRLSVTTKQTERKVKPKSPELLAAEAEIARLKSEIAKAANKAARKDRK